MGQKTPLERLYARIPHVECKKLCAASCGPISMAVEEVERMIAILPPYADPPRHCDHKLRCPFLAADQTCMVYDARPILCRLWGATDAMPCSHGCVVTPRRLTKPEAHIIMREYFALGGKDFVDTWPVITPIILGET